MIKELLYGKLILGKHFEEMLQEVIMFIN